MPTVNDLYLQVVNDQRDHLAKLQENFDKLCKELGEQTEAKIKGLDPKDAEAKQKILQEEKSLIDQALQNLKNDTNQSQLKTRQRLEEIQGQRERETLDKLEDQIAHL